MKKTLLIFTTLLTFALNAYADGAKHVAGTVFLPHPMKVLLANFEDFKITPKQEKQINTLVSIVPPKLHPMMDEARVLQHKIKKDVMKHKSDLKTVSSDLKKLESLKRKITHIQINAINKIQKILTNTQYIHLLVKLKANKICG